MTAYGPSRSGASGAPQVPVAPNREVLVCVVDDDDSVRRALSRLIRSAGLDVATFPSALAFLEALPLGRPACLVLDVRMPGTSGLDLQVALKREAPDIPIVFLTGYGNVPTTVRAMKDGAIDFLQKPLDDTDLLAAGAPGSPSEPVVRADRVEWRGDPATDRLTDAQGAGGP